MLTEAGLFLYVVYFTLCACAIGRRLKANDKPLDVGLGMSFVACVIQLLFAMNSGEIDRLTLHVSGGRLLIMPVLLLTGLASFVAVWIPPRDSLPSLLTRVTGVFVSVVGWVAYMGTLGADC